jgi:hypothetical protein
MLRNLKDQMWCWILRDTRLIYKFIFCNHSHWQKLCQTLLWHKFDQMCLDWNKLYRHEGHLITLDAHYKSQHFVGGELQFAKLICFLQPWLQHQNLDHSFVQINNHVNHNHSLKRFFSFATKKSMTSCPKWLHNWL